ncbi:MAG TPA: ABC transporter permease subunit [Chloroflexota bacterium]|nr:ABC transporter permease subunit [Chloroflexota bacterium]
MSQQLRVAAPAELHRPAVPLTAGRGGLRRLRRQVAAHWTLMLMLAPGLAYFVVFHYIPMAGIVLAFKRFRVAGGIWGSPWVGLANFEAFFNSYYASRIVTNSLVLNLLTLLFLFPVPIVLALLLNEVRHEAFKRAVQTVTYFPYFVAAVVMVGMVKMLFSPDPSLGVVNQLRLGVWGLEPINFVAEAGYFRPIYVAMLIWQNAGFGAIIYLAGLAAVDVQLYEAAIIDGANRLQLIRHISLPGLAPTIVVLLLLNISSLLRLGAEPILAFYSPGIYSTADVIETFVYRRGIAGEAGAPPDYAFATAVGLFQSVVGLCLIVAANRLARRVTGHSLW